MDGISAGNGSVNYYMLLFVKLDYKFHCPLWERLLQKGNLRNTVNARAIITSSRFYLCIIFTFD